ncbi:MAG: transcription antitermination factor NusB [Oscillospiraceae bacterium]
MISRHVARKNAFLIIFQKSFNDIPFEDMLLDMEESNICEDEQMFELDDFARSIVNAAIDNMAEIDSKIKPYLNKWTLERLPRVSLAVLRISCAQMLYLSDEKNLPDSVVINEAVELAKEYGGEEEYSFVNGTLGSFAKEIRGI